jgi:hypothetical protein
MANAYGFSADDAKRIGRAVRVVERLPPQLQNTGPATPEVSRGVRLLLAKHEGSNGWAVNASAVVTIHNGTPGSVASASTIVAYNQFLRIPASSGTAAGDDWVALGHNGFGWYAVSGSQQQGIRLGKTTASWAKNATATINVWENGSPGSETQSTGISLTNCVNKFAAVGSSKWVALAYGGAGAWYLIAAEC